MNVMLSLWIKTNGFLKDFTDSFKCPNGNKIYEKVQKVFKIFNKKNWPSILCHTFKNMRSQNNYEFRQLKKIKLNTFTNNTQAHISKSTLQKTNFTLSEKCLSSFDHFCIHELLIFHFTNCITLRIFCSTFLILKCIFIKPQKHFILVENYFTSFIILSDLFKLHIVHTK